MRHRDSWESAVGEGGGAIWFGEMVKGFDCGTCAISVLVTGLRKLIDGRTYLRCMENGGICGIFHINYLDLKLGLCIIFCVLK